MVETMTRDKNDIVHQRSHGAARLSVKRRSDQTHIDDLYQQGCAKLRLPTSRNNALQAVMINSSGGLTGGDRLDWSFKLGQETALTVTTQACERIYAASNDVAHTNISIEVAEGAKLAWLPQETILFDEGAYRRTIDIDLAQDAELFMVEPLIFGRKAMDEAVRNGFFKDRWRVKRAGILAHAEDALFEGDIESRLGNIAITKGGVAIATLLLIAPRSEFLVRKTRDILGEFGSASYWNGKLLARIVCEDGYHLREKLVPLIRLMNEGATLPKVWAL